MKTKTLEIKLRKAEKEDLIWYDKELIARPKIGLPFWYENHEGILTEDFIRFTTDPFAKAKSRAWINELLASSNLYVIDKNFERDAKSKTQQSSLKKAKATENQA